MNLTDEMVLIKKIDATITSDFYIAKYPVTQKEHANVFSLEIGEHDDQALQRTTWIDAIKYCNRLSQKNNLPVSYSEETGELIDSNGDTARDMASVKGFRLPTIKEWEYAAMGWSENKTGRYIEIQKKYYRVPFLDYPTTEKEKELFHRGYSNIDELVINTIGIFGMLVYASEWYSACESYNGIKNKMCRWEEYITNYNNDIGYTVSPKFCEDTDSYPFRIVAPPGWTGTTPS